MNKRNPRLVPYNLLDERTKKTNRDSVNNAVRTLIGYGYNIEPPDQESSESLCLEVESADVKMISIRIYIYICPKYGTDLNEVIAQLQIHICWDSYCFCSPNLSLPPQVVMVLRTHVEIKCVSSG